MDFKFVVWGTGFRAEALCRVIDEYIIAFIDNDSTKWNQKFKERNVISFEQYKKYYKQYPVIVTPIYVQNDICKQLEKDGIENYFLLQKNPPEFFGYGTNDIWKYVLSHLSEDKRNIIIGDNLYAMILYDKAMKKGMNATICLLDWFSKAFIHQIKQMECRYCMKYDVKPNDNVLSCLPRKKSDLGINIFDLSNEISAYWHPELKELRKTHNNESCFIVATGPSLQIQDLITLKKNGIYSFSVNRIFEVDNKIWAPDCYVFTDKKGIIDFKDKISEYSVPLKILTDEIHGDIKIEGNVRNIHVTGTNDYDSLPDFSEDISKRVYGFATVTYSVIQIAVYMGFKKIYLLGVDCNYIKGSTNNYFSMSKEIDTLDHHTNQMVQAYKSAKQYADSHGIKIYNATRGGMLEVFERVDFDSLF